MKEIWTFIYLFFFFKLVSMFSFVPRPDAIAILQWIAPEVPVVSTREDEGVSFNLDAEYEQALGTASEEELVDLAGNFF